MSCDFNCSNCAACNIKQETPKELLDVLKANIPDAEGEFIYNEFHHSRPYRVLLGVTADCNLRCPYCFTCRHGERMTYKIAEEAVNLAIANFIESDDEYKDAKPTVTFFGGEPMLEYESIIKPLINKFEDSVEWSMTTNGVLLDEDAVDFLSQNGVQILLSFDGIREIQDTQRPGAGFSSYDKVMKNIPYILVRYPEVAVRSTLTTKMIPHFYETYCMLEEMGFLRWHCAVNSYESWTEEDFIEAKRQVNKIGAHILDKVLRPDDYPILLFEPLTRLIQDYHAVRKGDHYFDNGVMRCGMGTTTFSVAPNGDIVPCQEELTAPKHVIGSVKTGIDPMIHEKFLQNYVDNIQKARLQTIGDLDQYSIHHRVVCPKRLLENDFQIEPTELTYTKVLMEAAARLYYMTRGSILPQIANLTGENLSHNLSQEIIEIPEMPKKEEEDNE